MSSQGLHQNVLRRRRVRRKVGRVWKPSSGDRLNLGCGFDYREGWVNVDQRPERADVAHDLTIMPWPFADASFDWIFADQILEHMPPRIDGQDGARAFLEEAKRILRIGGVLYVGVPYGFSKADLNKIDHYRHFGTNSFAYMRPRKEANEHFVLEGRFILRELPFLQTGINLGRKQELVFLMRKTAPTTKP